MSSNFGFSSVFVLLFPIEIHFPIYCELFVWAEHFPSIFQTAVNESATQVCQNDSYMITRKR